MSKNLKGSLLATTVIAGMAFAAPAFAQTTNPVPAPAVGEPTPTDTQGTAPPAAPDSANLPAGPQSSESAGPAEPTSAKEIVVTGTLIRNPNLVASAPVTVVGQEEIRLKQSNVAEDVLRTIPGVVPNVGSNTNNGNGGSSYVDLRGVGSNRNLVLLDGVRIVPADLTGRVDLNNIPLALVDRVDVLTGGASSTYGADAVGGVVNFITRSDFGGAELAVSDQITERGDGNTLRGDLTLGANFDDGRGNAVISIGYQEADPVYQGGERPFSSTALESFQIEDTSRAGSSVTTPSAFDFGGNPDRQQVTPDGTGFQKFYSSFNFNPYNIFQTPFKRYNLYSAGHYDITDHITVYGRGLYSNNTVDTIIAPSGVFGSSVTVPISNPFLTTAQRNFLCANADSSPAKGIQLLTQAQCDAAATALTPTSPGYQQVSFGLRRRAVEVGPRISDYNTKVFDFRVGVRGDITDKIGFDVFATRGQSDKIQTIKNYVLRSRVRDALLATNTTSCLSLTAGCVPLNIFGPAGSISPNQIDYITDNATTQVSTRLSQIRGTINGDTPILSPFATDPVSFAVGGEYRKYKASQAADLLAKSPGELGGGGGSTPEFTGGFDVYEGFAEVIAPLVTDRPFFNSLTVEAGIRRSHYTIDAPTTPKFNTTTYKIAGSWEPITDIKFRGNYQKAVRAPNIGELFTPVTTGLTNLGIDPCAGAAALANANLAAVCLAQGAPIGKIGTIKNPNAGQANVTGGGNPFVKPENAVTYTFGVVLKPRFIPGFNATVDYYNITVKDAISAPTPGDLINFCFGSNPTNPPASAATDPNCTIIQRNPVTGALDGDASDTPGLFAPETNNGYIKTSGIDVTLNYRRNLGMLIGAPAKLALAFGGNYTKESIFNGDVTSPVSVYRDCVGQYSPNCASIQPKYQFNERTTLSLGKVDLSLLWRYIHKVHYEDRQYNDEAAAAEAQNRDVDGTLLPIDEQGCPNYQSTDDNGCVIDDQFRRIKAYNYFDFSARFNVNEHFDFTLSAINLFDKKPPVVGNDIGSTTYNSGNTYPSTYDTLGRRFAAGARIKF